jgi:BolA protein
LLDFQLAQASNAGENSMANVDNRSRRDRIQETLLAAFAPQVLNVIDESHKHAGHMGHAGGADPGGGETHFRVQIVSTDFAGKSRIERHRSVHLALAGEFNGGVHALALELRAPGEA